MLHTHSTNPWCAMQSHKGVNERTLVLEPNNGPVKEMIGSLRVENPDEKLEAPPAVVARLRRQMQKRTEHEQDKEAAAYRQAIVLLVPT